MGHLTPDDLAPYIVIAHVLVIAAAVLFVVSRRGRP
jgi:hypothetical protein